MSIIAWLIAVWPAGLIMKGTGSDAIATFRFRSFIPAVARLMVPLPLRRLLRRSQT